MTDYRKWDAIAADLSDDEADEATRPLPKSTQRPSPADAATLVDRLAQAEQLGEEVLTEKQQMVELDRRRNQNREALASFRRAEREGDRAAEKHWMCIGSSFIRRPHASAKELLEEDQRRIDNELDALRTSVKRKTSLLCELDPSMCVQITS
jgi:chaperonin cofactor prefoldin